MATKTERPMLARYAPTELTPAFRLTYPHEGTEYVAGFDTVAQLRSVLVENAVDGRVIEYMLSWVEEALEAEHALQESPLREVDAGIPPLGSLLGWSEYIHIALVSVAVFGPPILIGFAAKWYWGK